MANLFWKSFYGLFVFAGISPSDVKSLMARGSVVGLI
jgi:hypothetical protein